MLLTVWHQICRCFWDLYSFDGGFQSQLLHRSPSLGYVVGACRLAGHLRQLVFPEISKVLCGPMSPGFKWWSESERPAGNREGAHPKESPSHKNPLVCAQPRPRRTTRPQASADPSSWFPVAQSFTGTTAPFAKVMNDLSQVYKTFTARINECQ